MGYFDDPLGGKNPWIDRGPTYVRDVEVVEDTSKIRAWQDHAEKLQAAFQEVVRSRSIIVVQRDAWFETCETVRKQYAPQVQGAEVNRIYDAHKKRIFAEKGIKPE